VEEIRTAFFFLLMAGTFFAAVHFRRSVHSSSA
jgi:hypothetical protein